MPFPSPWIFPAQGLSPCLLHWQGDSSPLSHLGSPEHQYLTPKKIMRCYNSKAWFYKVAQMAKCLPAMWETQVQSMGWEDPLEKEMTTHASTLAWKILQTEEPGRLQSMGWQRVGRDWATSFFKDRCVTENYIYLWRKEWLVIFFTLYLSAFFNTCWRD